MTRDEAIMILKNEQPHCGKRALFPEEKKYEAYDVAIKALEQQTCEDAASRQAVLAICDKYNGQGYVWTSIRGEVEQLPSVKPQYTEDEIQKMQDLEEVSDEGIQSCQNI